MLLAGARNKTEKELRDVLGYNAAGISKPLAQALYRFLLTEQRDPHVGYALSILNYIVVHSGITLLPAYEGILKNIFFTSEQKIPFGRPNATVNSFFINATTNDKIKFSVGNDSSRLVNTAVVEKIKFFNAANNSSRLVLVSAMIFNGTWKTKFRKNLTTDHPFNNGTSINAIPFMNTEDIFPYYQNKEKRFQVLELPYSGEETSMIIFLPNNVSGLPKLEKESNLTTFKIALKHLRPTRVTVKIPKFVSSSNLQLEEVLKGLGMKNSFSPAADFTGIDGHKGLFVSKAVQGAAINVTEGDTVSGSFADTFVKRDSRLLPIVGRATFTADHPFVYMIFHRPTGIILFMGRKTVTSRQS